MPTGQQERYAEDPPGEILCSLATRDLADGIVAAPAGRWMVYHVGPDPDFARLRLVRHLAQAGRVLLAQRRGHDGRMCYLLQRRARPGEAAP